MTTSTDLVFVKARVEQFFWLARERYQIKLRKDAGLSRPEWTTDPLLSKYHFCNVFRADDRVSRAIRELAGRWDPWPAVLLGRLCNKEATVRAMGDIQLGALLTPRVQARLQGSRDQHQRLPPQHTGRAE